MISLIALIPSKFAEAEIRKIATHSLESNIVLLNGKKYLAAGAHHFHSLWTRDFAYSVPGLLKLGKVELVRDQLDLILSFQRPSGHIPKMLDSEPNDSRIISSVFRYLFRLPVIPTPMKHPVQPMFEDRLGSLAIDSGILVLIAAMQYVEATLDQKWWLEKKPQLMTLFRTYDEALREGLIYQPPYSDWQDSVQRAGYTFLTNLQYWVVLEKLSKLDPVGFGVTPADVEHLKERILGEFFDRDSGVFLSQGVKTGEKQTSLDGNLFAISFGFLNQQDAKNLYDNLKRHPLWMGSNHLPGSVTFPCYPENQKATHIRLVQMSGYHDKYYWSWLMAFVLKVARLMGDEETVDMQGRVLNFLLTRDLSVSEVYDAQPGLPQFARPLMRSEAPFSWGAAFVIDALQSPL